MRLIGIIHDEDDAREFSNFLLHEGIHNECEITHAEGSDERECKIWVESEDHVDAAQQWFTSFQEDPKSFLFRGHPPKLALKSSDVQKLFKKNSADNGMGTVVPQSGGLTAFLIALCSVLFLLSSIVIYPWAYSERTVSLPAALVSPIYKELLYDFPKSYELLEKLLASYGIDVLENPDNLSDSAKLLVEQQKQTASWPGIYPLFLNAYHHQKQPQDYKLFEKISSGELWRLISPCLLHGDILHIIFNMIWLAVLGISLERNVGKGRYLLLMALLGIFSNTAQYLMSGANFLGFSGIISGMLSFIWMRQKYFPWEGYRLHKSTIVFVLVFIFGMAGLSLIGFVFDLMGSSFYVPMMANTAHLSGLLLGAILGRMGLFAVRL